MTTRKKNKRLQDGTRKGTRTKMRGNQGHLIRKEAEVEVPLPHPEAGEEGITEGLISIRIIMHASIQTRFATRPPAQVLVQARILIQDRNIL